MIISGPEGSGKYMFAKYIAMCLGCKSMFRPCLSCDECVRIDEGNCPDVFTLDLPEDKKTIGVPEIRRIKEDAYIAPDVLDVKVYIIRNADSMTPQAQNALLKLFEEPPKNVYFILTCVSVSGLLPTVRSRTIELRTQIFTNSELEDYFLLEDRAGGVDEKTLKEAIKLSCGTVGNVKKFLSTGKTDKMFSYAENVLRSLSSGDYTSVLSCFLQLSQSRTDVSGLLDFLLLAIRDVSSCKRCREEIDTFYFTDRSTAKELSSNFSLGYLCRLYDTVLSYKEEIDNQNVNVKTAVSNMTAAIRGLPK